MNHRIVIERLFSLGQYKNIKIIAETNDIPDDVWENEVYLNNEREALASEIFANFTIYKAMEKSLEDLIKEEDWEGIIERLNLGDNNE